VTSVTLTAYGTAAVSGLSSAQARALAATGALSVTPGWDAGSWTLSASSYVGVLHIDGVEIRIRPRIAISRLVFLLGYAQDPKAWRDDPVGLDDQADLWPAMAQVFTRQADRALERGLLQGYRTEESAQVVLRGRLLVADQLRLHAGLAVPLELRFDEYDVDIPENQLLRAAAERLLKLPRMPVTALRRLRGLLVRLADVTRLVPGQPVPITPSSRLNARYRPALALARMVLRSRSVDVLDAGIRATGFLVNMNTVFEDFVTVSLTEALAPFGGRCVAQDRHALDEARQVKLRPDLVRYGPAGRQIAVVDAKYKAETPSGYPHADLYQVLAYCTALRLPVGHLVYAEGEELASSVRVRNAGITILRHALSLHLPVPELLARVDLLAEQIAGHSTVARSTDPALANAASGRQPPPSIG
jgi:5-methylcytosine-specific restriction enzyme subunit McrC